MNMRIVVSFSIVFAFIAILPAEGYSVRDTVNGIVDTLSGLPLFLGIMDNPGS